MRFKFRYETLLRIRRQLEDERKRIVAARLQEIAETESHRQAILDRIRQQSEETRRALSAETVNVDELKFGRHWMLRLQRGVLEADATIVRQRAALAEERVRLAEAARAVKVLVRLKERRQAAYEMEMNRREQLELDEISVLRHGRVGTEDRNERLVGDVGRQT
ncbi:MAG: flagellar FliJ family protein [Phycisphaerae bacterium]|nr:flagellar FliJ family protein [Phycisphaerae bacterium]